jgi:hypothetical protein
VSSYARFVTSATASSCTPPTPGPTRTARAGAWT